MYGINNNTGMTYQNSNSIAKMNRQNTDANGRGSKKIKNAINVLNEFNGLKSNSGFERLTSAANLISKAFSG